MTMPAVQERVDRLEESIDHFIASVGVEFNKLYNSQMRTEAELRAFKDEMRALNHRMDTFLDYFSEYRDLPLIGLLATLDVEESVLSYAEKQGFLVLALGDEIMEVKNHSGFEPKRW